MSLLTSQQAAAATAKRYAGTGGYKWRRRSMYMGVGADQSNGSLEPQAFLIEIEPPGGYIRPHFHASKQFQVFVAGGGTIGKQHDLAPLVVHYTDAFTTYGPIVIEEEGLSFFTLRHKHDSGAQYMPDSRDKAAGIPGKPGRSRTARVADEFRGAATCSPGEVRSAEIIPRESDGLTAWAYCAGPDSQVVGPSPSSGDGAYWLVTSGALVCEGTTLPRHSLLYLRQTEPPLRGQSGPEGVSLLCLQYGELDIRRGG